MLTRAIEVRGAEASDLPSIAAIQAASPEAAQWNPNGYLKLYECSVAVVSGRVVGYLVARQNVPEEREILNLAVDPEARRQGVARALLEDELGRHPRPQGEWYLEVRASNQGAIRLYSAAGFQAVGRRDGYYNNPPEAAIVMRFDSCYRQGA